MPILLNCTNYLHFPSAKQLSDMHCLHRWKNGRPELYWNYKCSDRMVWRKTVLFSRQQRNQCLCLSLKGDAMAPKLRDAVSVSEKVAGMDLEIGLWERKKCVSGECETLICKWVSASSFSNCVYSDETSHAIVIFPQKTCGIKCVDDLDFSRNL